MSTGATPVELVEPARLGALIEENAALLSRERAGLGALQLLQRLAGAAPGVQRGDPGALEEFGQTMRALAAAHTAPGTPPAGWFEGLSALHPPRAFSPRGCFISLDTMRRIGGALSRVVAGGAGGTATS